VAKSSNQLPQRKRNAEHGHVCEKPKATMKKKRRHCKIAAPSETLKSEKCPTCPSCPFSSCEAPSVALRMTGAVAGFYLPQADIRARLAAVKKYSRVAE
jgi:hypothetical protein